MPGRDRTGPEGRGPMTGRGAGLCGSGRRAGFGLRCGPGRGRRNRLGIGPGQNRTDLQNELNSLQRSITLVQAELDALDTLHDTKDSD